MVLLCYNISKGGVFMILVYTSFGCASCRKVKQWLKDRNIPFVEKNIFTMMLNEKELRMLLRRSENGTDDLISKRSKIIKENNIDIDEMSTTELIQFIQQNPSVLKRPIMVDERQFLVGYDEEEIEIFIPRELQALADCSCNADCPNFETCGKLRKGLA